MTDYRSSLAPLAQACREPDEANARRAAATAWHKHGIILMRADWFTAWPDKKQAELLAEKLYGRRGE